MSQNIFDLSERYNEMLNKGIRLSGEDKFFFIVGRLKDLRRRLPGDFRPRRILDYGCGIGETEPYLAEAFPGAEIVGVDTSEIALAHASKHFSSLELSFQPAKAFSVSSAFDLCYVNGVFHHIPREERLDVVKTIHRALRPGGFLALFENSPWNPGMRLAMSRIPFDRDAELLKPHDVRRLLDLAGFSRCSPPRFLFYFPHILAWLRFMEPCLARVPFGAQYYVLALK